MRRGMRQPLSTVFREAVTPAQGRFLWRRSARVTILAAMTFLFQACEEDIAFPQPEKVVVWEEIDTGYEAGWINAMTRGMSGEIIVGSAVGSRPEVFISRDGGESWEGSGNGLNPNGGISSFACTDEGLLFAGIDEGGVFLSRDGGENWIQMNNRLSDIYITDLAIAPSGDLLASTSHGVIFRSSDNASSWTLCETLSSVYDLFVSSRGAVYAGSSWDRLFLSEDSGITWAPVQHGQEDIGSVASLAEDIEGTIYASTGAGVIMKSGDPGMPWTVCYADSMARQIRRIIIDEAGRIFGALSSYEFIVSGDGGATWERINNPGGRDNISSMMIYDGSLILGTMNRGLFRSRDQGQSWNIMGWDKLHINAMVRDRTGVIFLCTDSGVLRSGENEIGWVPITGNLNYGWYNMILGIHPEGYLYNAGNGIYISENRDGRWTRVDSIFGSEVFSIEIDEKGTIFAGTGAGIVRSADASGPFEIVAEDIVDARAIRAAGGGMVFGAGNSGAFMSMDDGLRWERVMEGTRVYSIDIDEAGNVYAAMREGMMISQDTCTTWAASKVGGYGEFPVKVIVLPDSRIMAVTDDCRVFHSSDKGKVWTLFDTGLGRTLPDDFYLSSDGYLYYYGAGLRRLRASELGKL